MWSFLGGASHSWFEHTCHGVEVPSHHPFGDPLWLKVQCLWIHNLFLWHLPVAWKCKSMKSVVLSTTEAEYVAASEVVKEIKILYQMLRSMEVKVPLPIKVQVDNVAAIWLANNSHVSERTKHVDLRAHFVRDMIKDQVIEIYFVKSAENHSDIMTKNQQGQHYLYAKSKLVYTVQEMNEQEDH